MWLDTAEAPALTRPTEVDVVVVHYWTDQHMPVASYDAVTGEVRSSRRSSMRLVDDWHGVPARYYLDNVVDLLAPGQWYWESDTGRLTYLPLPGEEPGTTEVVAPWARQLLRFDRASWLRFEGLSLRETDWDVVASPHRRWPFHGFEAGVDYASTGQAAADLPGVVATRHSTHLTFDLLDVRGTGWHAFDIGPGSSDVAVTRSRLTDLGASGVKVEGAAAAGPGLGPREDRVEGVLVEDCSITQGGQVFHAAPGVVSLEASRVRVRHCEIADFDYTGVSLGWMWGYAETATRDNLVESCVIRDIGRGRLSDLGGIYTLGVQPGTVLRGNVISGIRSGTYGAGGIYLDEGSSHILVEHNVVHGVETAALQVHYARENVVRHNVLVGGDQGPVLLHKGEDHEAFTIERNVLVTEGAEWFVSGVGYAAPDPAQWPVTSDLNVLQADGEAALAEAWLGRGRDTHSVVGDARFVDPKRPELGLTEDSPAWALGFRPWDWSSAGPRGDVGP